MFPLMVTSVCRTIWAEDNSRTRHYFDVAPVCRRVGGTDVLRPLRHT
jgi:hypothetical protein